MADEKITALTALAELTATDILPCVDDVGGSPVTKYITAANLVASVSWAHVSGSWTYASASTINIPAGGSGIYSVGEKIRFKQGGGYKYFYIVGLTDVLLTVTGGSDYTVANTGITDVYHSRAICPLNFPRMFNTTAPTWTASGTAFTNQPTNLASKIWMADGMFFLSGVYQCHATSGGTNLFTATFSSEVPAGALSAIGTVQGNGLAGTILLSSSSPRAPVMSKYDGTTLATNSQYMYFTIGFEI